MDHSVLPLPRKNRRLSMGFFFCRDYVFQFTTTDGLYGSQYRRLFFWYYYIRRKDWGSFSSGSTGPHFTSSSPFSPTKEPLRRFLQQDVQPSLAYPAIQPHLLGTNDRRCASVDSHGSNALHCCTSSSCSTCPTIPGAHATNLESRIFLFPSRQQALAHLRTV